VRIKTKLISVYLGIAILFSLIGFYGVQYTAHVGALFRGVEADSIPSLTALMEIIAATRQSSIKAMEFSLHGRPNDQKKALEALKKVEDGLTTYKTTMLDNGPAKEQNLDVKINRFVQAINSYLSLGAGPGVYDLIKDVDSLHEFRSDLIRVTNKAIQHEPKQLELSLQNIKSEARKVSIKAVEFALDGKATTRTKAEEAIRSLAGQLKYYSQHSKSSADLRKPIVEKGESYITTSRQYLKDIATSNVSLKSIQEMEKQVHQLRREVIHALYPLIEVEKEELHEAADQTHASIANAAYILMGSIAGVVLVALIAGSLVGRSITKPLQKLNEAAHHIAEGDLKLKLDIHSTDEIGELATSFEHMKEELKKHHDHMEELVKERTIALENSNKELESYSYSIAHDLRTPLRSIVGFSQIILEDASDKLDSADQEHLQRIIKAATHMAELIDDILELSRVSRSHMQFDKVNLSAICSELSETFNASDTERVVEWRIQPDLVANGDHRLLYLVLNNLLGNAWKFTQQKSDALIEFGFMHEAGEKVYYVRDNGTGFDMKYVDKLFGLFQRLHRADEYEGTGIGLATAQRIINRHNGWVRAEGEKGKGATFYFSIPENI